MEPSEKEMWEININNAVAEATKYSEEVVDSVFARYEAHDFYDLAPMYYSEVFAEVEMIANDD